MASLTTTANIQSNDETEPPLVQTLNSSAPLHPPLARELAPTQPNLLSASSQITPAIPNDPSTNQDKPAEGDTTKSLNGPNFRSLAPARSSRGRGMQALPRLRNIYIYRCRERR